MSPRAAAPAFVGHASGLAGRGRSGENEDAGSHRTGRFTERRLHILRARMHDHVRKLAGTIRIQTHRAFGIVGIRGDGDACLGAQVQEPEHVTAGKRTNEQFLGVVAVSLAAGVEENGIALIFAGAVIWWSRPYAR